MSAYAILRISGSDATSFLQSQLSADITDVTRQCYLLAAWCDAKGRALCTLRVLADGKDFLLLLPADLAPAISRRLHMYVLRAKVSIADESADWVLQAGIEEATLSHGEVERDAQGFWLGLDTGSGPALLRLQRADADNALAPAGSNSWQLAEIDAGLPEITQATSGQFVPQMLNLHWLGGIDFHKGCYPGQEVVARLQYRGRLKQHLFRLQWHGEQPQPGDDVLTADGKRQGTVIRAAHEAEAESGTGRLLAVIRLTALEQTLATAAASLTLLELPYPTPAD